MRRASLHRLPLGVEQLSPRRLERIAKADEGQRRLGQDGPGEYQHRIGDDQIHHVRKDVASDDVQTARADDASAVDERTLLQ